MSVTLNGTSGLVFSDGTTQASAGVSGFRNVLYNGAFEVAQRGTTFNDGAGFHNQYGLDRWSQGQFQGGPQTRVSVSSPVTGMTARYACRISSSTTAQVVNGTRMALGQKVESVNSIPLRGQIVTLSFWVRFSAATITSVSNSGGGGNNTYADWYASLWYNTSTTDATFASTGADSFANAPLGSNGVTFTNGFLPTTWTRVTMTVTAPTNLNNIGVRFNFGSLGSTATAGTAWYEVTEVQLERGGGATAFEHRPIGVELALCQRYCVKLSDGKTSGFAMCNLNAGEAISQHNLPVVMRATPTLLPTGVTGYGSGATQYRVYQFNQSGGGFNAAPTTASIFLSYSSPSQVWLIANQSAAWANPTVYDVTGGGLDIGSSVNIILSAEL